MAEKRTSDDAASPAEPGRELEAVNAGRAGLQPGAMSRGETAPNEPLRMIDRFLLANLHSRKELEAVQVVLDARIELLRHQAAAASRESKTYWDARSAEVVAGMKTYVQARLRAIENERMASRLDSLESAYRTFAGKVREVETGTLPEEIRGELIRKMRQNLDETIGRLERDAIAEKHDLTD